MKHTRIAIIAFWALLASPVLVFGQAAPSLTITPSTMAFTYVTGTAALPTPVNAQVKLSGSSTVVPFRVAVPPTAPWLIVSPTTANTGTSVAVRVNPTSLLAGQYTALVGFSVQSVAPPGTLTVTLTVKNPPPAMSTVPTTIATTWATDQAAPASVPISVKTDGEPVSFTAAVTGGAWLSIDKPTGIAMAGSPVTVTASMNTAGLLPGNYASKITFTSANASNKTVSVSAALTVAPGVAVIGSIWPSAAPLGSNDSTITLTGQNFFKASVVTAGNVALSATWISTSIMLAVIPKAVMTNVGLVPITVTNSPQPASNVATFTVTPPGPQIAMVVNAASFNPSAATPNIAPLEIISIFGSGLGPSSPILTDPVSGVFPVTAGAPPTVVEFELTPGNWVLAPILMAVANQVNAVAPFNVGAGNAMNLRVTYNNLVSAPFPFNGVAADPGLFTTDSSGRGQGAILNFNSTTGAFTLNSDSNQATRGSTVVLYLTGGGVTSPLPDEDGEVIPLTGTVPTLVSTPSVTIGGDGAVVQSATSVPGCIAGLVQLNITVPATVTPAKGIPVVVSMAGYSSPATATISVK